ncbi:MAG: twin-arginine translocase TatA/TatE family subunit [Acidimicrobiales bacterium]
MGGLDPAKLLVILVLALVLIGPERLPRAARQVGAFWREFTQFRERLEDQVRSAMPDLDLPKIPVIPRSGVTGYLTGMMRDADRGTTGVEGAEADMDAPGRTERDGVGTPWQSAGSRPGENTGAGHGVAPNGIPAGWHSQGAQAPGYASGALFTSFPSAAPEALIGAEARLDLDDPSWN